MRSLLLIYSRELPEVPSTDEVDQLVRTHCELIADARRKGVLLGRPALTPVEAAECGSVVAGPPPLSRRYPVLRIRPHRLR